MVGSLSHAQDVVNRSLIRYYYLVILQGFSNIIRYRINVLRRDVASNNLPQFVMSHESVTEVMSNVSTEFNQVFHLVSPNEVNGFPYMVSLTS